MVKSLSSRPASRIHTFDLHPLYASILRDHASIAQGDVLGLDGDLRAVVVAPATGTIRLLVTGEGSTRRVKVFLTEAHTRSSSDRSTAC